MTVSPPDGLDPRDVRVANVWKAGRPAATLTRTDAGVEFAYLPDYLSSPGPPVATTLPVSDRAVLAAAGGVPPYFAGLLPEGRRLLALRRVVQTSADDDLSLLLAVGADPVGDVQVLPSGAPPEFGPPPRTLIGSLHDVDFTDVLAEAGVVDPSALAGVQDKVSARMLTLPVVHEGRAHLLKLDPPELPHLVRNEGFFLRWARSHRLPVVEAEIVHDRRGRPGLLVTRFDRVVTPDGALRRLAVEDGTQLLGLYPAAKYTITAERLLGAVASACPARLPAAREAFRHLVVAFLTGNDDLHGKNLSVVEDATTREWRVSPAYDIPSTLPYQPGRLALPVGGRRDTVTRATLGGLADDLGLPATAAERVIAEALRATDGLADAVAVLPFDPARQRSLTRGLRARRAALAH